MVVLGVLHNTTDRLSEHYSRCASLLSVTHVARHELQSLLGAMSFVTSCVRPRTLVHVIPPLRPSMPSVSKLPDRIPSLITRISVGGATSYRTIMAFLSSRSRPGSMIACSSRQMHAAPRRGIFPRAVLSRSFLRLYSSRVWTRHKHLGTFDYSGRP